MADLLPIIETCEHRWMRAWVGRDMRELKALTSGKFIMLVGSRPPVILDARSWLDSAASRYRCKAYRFGDIYVRNVGALALFASQVDIEATVDGHDWSGRIWVTDLWRKSKVRRGWRMIQRVITRTEEDAQLPGAIRALQLWR